MYTSYENYFSRSFKRTYFERKILISDIKNAIVSPTYNLWSYSPTQKIQKITKGKTLEIVFEQKKLNYYHNHSLLFMNTKYDKIADALYIKFKKGKIAKTLRLENHLIVDLDSKSNILGIELLNIKSQLTPATIKQFSRKKEIVFV